MDVLIALDQRSIREHVKELSPESRVLFDLYEKPVDSAREFPGSLT